jgi:hypothetical protein
LFFRYISLLITLFLTACAANHTCDQAPQEPYSTLDIDAIYTQAAQTAFVQMTEQALSATPTPTASVTPTITATSTPRPTATVWRIEPTVTYVKTLAVQRPRSGRSELTDFGLGRHIEFSDDDTNLVKSSLLEFFEAKNKPLNNDTYYFYVLNAIELDLDRDGQDEIAVAYQFGQTPWQKFGVAVLRNGKVLDADVDLLDAEFGQVSFVVVPLDRQKNGLLFKLYTTTTGSGIHPATFYKMYQWQSDRITIAWDWNYYGGGRLGAAFYKFQEERLRLMHLSGKPELDILLSRKADNLSLSFSNPENYLHYQVDLPGGLVFSWHEDSHSYRLSHFYNGANVSPIRPVDFIAHAPRVAKPIRIDGTTGDWLQVEYLPALDGYGKGTYHRSFGLFSPQLAWDDKWLYFTLAAHPYSLIYLAFDTDLQSDFEVGELNEDDYLFEIDMRPLTDEMALQPCLGYTARQIHPHPAKMDVATSVLGNSIQHCQVEGRISLRSLGITTAPVRYPGYALQVLPTTLTGIEKTYPFTLYRPSSGKLIGFAVFAENEISAQSYQTNQFLSFSPHDPTTWGTLIFISDR